MGDGKTAEADCPIIAQWMTLDALVSRAARGKIAEVHQPGLTRETVADNAELLEPILEHMGRLAQKPTNDQAKDVLTCLHQSHSH